MAGIISTKLNSENLASTFRKCVCEAQNPCCRNPLLRAGILSVVIVVCVYCFMKLTNSVILFPIPSGISFISSVVVPKPFTQNVGHPNHIEPVAPHPQMQRIKFLLFFVLTCLFLCRKAIDKDKCLMGLLQSENNCFSRSDCFFESHIRQPACACLLLAQVVYLSSSTLSL